jgi:broad specificity phosphatase PhoE
MVIKYIFIRHADKKWKNNKGPDGCFQHDPPLKENTFTKITLFGNKLIIQHGFPNMIIMSPYLRVRQTVQELISIHTSREMYKCIDMNISEYLGNQNTNIDVSEETKYYSTSSNFENICRLPKPGESMRNLKNRVDDHIDSIHILSDDIINTMEDDKIIWIVTHGIIIQYIHEILRRKKPLGISSRSFYPDSLSGFVITKTSTELSISYLT